MTSSRSTAWYPTYRRYGQVCVGAHGPLELLGLVPSGSWLLRCIRCGVAFHSTPNERRAALGFAGKEGA